MSNLTEYNELATEMMMKAMAHHKATIAAAKAQMVNLREELFAQQNLLHENGYALHDALMAVRDSGDLEAIDAATMAKRAHFTQLDAIRDMANF